MRILVATDGSHGADRAVDYAARMAHSQGAELLIVNVMGGLSDALFRSFDRGQHAWLDELLQSTAAEILTKARQRAGGLGVATIQVESRRGDVAQSIIDIAGERHADVVVVGRRGEGQIAGLLLGSVSQKLTSLAPLPVIVVP